MRNAPARREQSQLGLDEEEQCKMRLPKQCKNERKLSHQAQTYFRFRVYIFCGAICCIKPLSFCRNYHKGGATAQLESSVLILIKSNATSTWQNRNQKCIYSTLTRIQSNNETILDHVTPIKTSLVANTRRAADSPTNRVYRLLSISPPDTKK